MIKNAHIPVSSPWVAVDLDGTLMEDGYFPEFGPPRKGAVESCNRLKEQGIKIMIFTARTGMTDLHGQYQNVNKVVEDIYAWGRQYSIPIDYIFPLPKPTFVLAFFDDRAITVGPEEDGWVKAWGEFETRYLPLENWQKAILPPEKSNE